MAKQITESEDPRKGSVAYPYTPLGTALRLGEIVFECGGSSGPVPKSVLAGKLEVSDSSPTFYNLVGSAKSYGIVEGRGQVILTELGKAYFDPVEEGARRKAELAFFRNPPVFRFLINRFDGHKLPDSAIIGKLLHQQKIAPESWAGRVGGIFLSSAQSLGLIDAGFLRYEMALHSAEANTGNGHNPKPDFSKLPDGPVAMAFDAPPEFTGKSPRPNATAAIPSDKNVWFFDGGSIKLETPNPMSKKMWEKLTKYVELLEPPEEPEGGST